MTEHKYTDEQIIEALKIRMPHDEVCREAYDLIKRQQAKIDLRSHAIPSDGDVDEFDVELAENMFSKRELAQLYVKKLDEYDSLKKCTDCVYFLGCECFDGKTCDMYEKR